MADRQTHKIYYYLNKLMSNTWAYFYIAIGSRGRGKTTSAWRWVLKRYLNHGEQFAWLRLTEAPLKKMSRQGGSTLVAHTVLKELKIDAVVLRRAKVYIRRVGSNALEEVGIIDALSTFYTSKGEDLSAYTNIVIDEINRETSEHNTFDLIDAFIKQIETIARLRKNVRVLMLGNTINETSEILSIFNFQPKTFGLYKLKRQHCVIEYLADSPEWLEARKDSLAGSLLKSSEEDNSAFTNISQTDYSNITTFNNRYRPLYILEITNTYKVEAYEMKEGLLIDTVRADNVRHFRLNQFLTTGGLYSKQLIDDLLELNTANKLYFTTVLKRSKFLLALQKNK